MERQVQKDVLILLGSAGAPGWTHKNLSHPSGWSAVCKLENRLMDCLQRLESESFDLAMVEISAIEAEGLVSLERISRHSPELPILVFNRHAPEQVHFWAHPQLLEMMGIQDEFDLVDMVAGALGADETGFPAQVNVNDRSAQSFNGSHGSQGESVQGQSVPLMAAAFAEALAKTAVSISQSLPLNEMFTSILQQTGRVFLHDLAMIVLADGEGGHVSEVWPAAYQTLKGRRFPLAELPLLSEMHACKRPLQQTLFFSPTNWTQPPEIQGIKSFMGAPICLHNEVAGFLLLGSMRPLAFQANNTYQLQAFAAQLSVAIQNAGLHAQLETLNTHLDVQVAQRTQQMQHEKERLEAILFNSPDMILFLSLENQIVLVNSIFYKTFGLTEKDVYGRSLDAVLPIADKAELTRNLEDVIHSGHFHQRETVAMLPAGQAIDIEIRLAPIKNGRINGILCHIRNITATKLAERTKDAFVANVSHELKSPITSLVLYHQLLQLNPDKQTPYFARLERETSRLNQLLDDLLCLSRLDQNRTQLHLGSVDLNETLSNLVEDRQLIAEMAHLTLAVTDQAPLPPVWVDGGLVEQVISSILTNAMNYTPAGGVITASTRMAQREGKAWCGIAIQDSGPGITPEDQPRIFDRFYRGEAAVTSQAPGTGLGLAIAAEIISRHQGHIEVFSEGKPGKGSTFIVWLPAEA